MADLKIRVMRPEDFGFAVKITKTANWGFTAEDFKRMCDLEPRGCFVGLLREKHVAMLTTAVYDTVAWIGNVIVEPDLRGKGIGAQLMSHAINALRAIGVRTVGLYAYENVVGFYRELGFEVGKKYSRYSARGRVFHPKTVRKMLRTDLKRIFTIDKNCFGHSRKKLLARLFSDFTNHCYITAASKNLVGFIMANPGEAMEIGPWISDPKQPENARELLEAVMTETEGKPVNIGIPNHNKLAVKILKELEFKKQFEVYSMYYRDDPPVIHKDCFLGMESLERG